MGLYRLGRRLMHLNYIKGSSAVEHDLRLEIQEMRSEISQLRGELSVLRVKSLPKWLSGDFLK